MPTLSLIMIVKDESACLAECLESVRHIVDEMVIADTGSTDDTCIIAHRYGAKISQIPWNNDFAAARNAGMAHAVGDWLLHLDADEVVDPVTARRIREWVDADGMGADAIELTLANYCNLHKSWRWVPALPGDPMARGYAGYIAAPLLRLFRNGRGFGYREAVHENITESVLEKGGKIRREPLIIHHYGYSGASGSPNPKDYLYLEIARAKVTDRPDDPKSWHDLGEQLLALGEKAEGEAACRRAYALAPDNLDAATSVAHLLLERGDLDEARGVLDDLIRRGLAAPHIVAARAAVDLRQGRTDEAHRLIEATLNTAPTYVTAWLLRARCADLEGDATAASQALDTAFRIAPSLSEVNDRREAAHLRAAGEQEFVAGRVREALDCFVQALRLDPEDPLLHNNIGVALADMGAWDKARESISRALRLAPAWPDATTNYSALGG